MKRTLSQHLEASTLPKKILSLDGGGIRGALTLGYLKKIEDILKEQHGDDPSFRLCDYFDLIGGTSTGSIIAAALAIGKSVDEIKDLYLNLGGEIFAIKKDWWNPMQTWSYLKAEYDFSALENSLKKIFGTMTLGSDQIKTGLCIVAKRADTNSTWPLINHPEGMFYPLNKNILLWQAIRASTAAPTYFVPQMIDVGRGERAAFIDGGVSMANNPAFTLLTVAALDGFPFHWPMGAENLAIVSVGTGHGIFKKQTGEIAKAWLKDWAKKVPDMLMQDASWQNQIMLQWLSDSPTACEIDMEMNTLKKDFLSGQPLIKYLRYNFCITENDLNGLGMDKSFTEKDVVNLLEMSNSQNRNLLYDIGVADAQTKVTEKHFTYLG